MRKKNQHSFTLALWFIQVFIAWFTSVGRGGGIQRFSALDHEL